MENYRRVRQPRSEPVEADPSQVLVASLGNPVRLAREVKAKLEAADAKITVTAMGQAVGKAVAVAELLKRHVSGLHQHTKTTTISLTDVWEPKVEGLEPIETKRLAPGIEIVLAKQPFDGSVPVPEQDAAEAAAELEALESGLDTGAPPGRARGGGRGGRPRGGRGSRAPDGEAPPPVVRGGRPPRRSKADAPLAADAPADE